jgi:hypothetical protein
MQTARSSCTSSEFITLKRKLENLEEISQNTVFANSPAFSQNVINFQTEFKDSKFATFSPLRQKFQKLIESRIESPYKGLLSNLNGCDKLKKKIEQDFEDTQQNLVKTMDSKIEELEIRLTRKIEEILDEKLEKVLTNLRKIVTAI